MKYAFVFAALLALSGCETPTTQRYAISADNNSALRELGAKGIGVSTFKAPPDFSANCRALGPMQVADGLSHTQYIQRAFEDELKVAGAYSSSPRAVLGGTVTRLEFTTMRGITGGTWDIELKLQSSNGKSLDVSEHYEFDSGFVANDACRNTADAFLRAVQNLVGRAFKSPGFAALVQ